MRRAPIVLLSVVLAPLVIAASGCSSDPSKSGITTGSSSIDESFVPRFPEDNILGENRPDGTCSPDVIDIDHGKHTADFTYSGQPGDQVTLNIILKGKPPQEESFELGSSNTKWQVPTDIYNGDIIKVVVKAEGRVGRPSSCVINVS